MCVVYTYVCSVCVCVCICVYVNTGVCVVYMYVYERVRVCAYVRRTLCVCEYGCVLCIRMYVAYAYVCAYVCM